MMYFILAVLLVFTGCNRSVMKEYGAGTTVIGIRTSEGIWMALDTRKVSFPVSGSPNQNLRYDTVCKLHRAGARLYAASGMAYDDFIELARKHLMTPYSLEISVNNFKKDAVFLRGQLLIWLKENRTEDYEKYFDKFKNLSFMFFCIEDEIPKMMGVEIVIQGDAKDPVRLSDTVRYFNQKLLPNDAEFYVIGHSDKVFELSSNPAFRTGKTDIEILEGLLDAESNNDTITVARPYDILFLNLQGSAKIFSESGKCNLR